LDGIYARVLGLRRNIEHKNHAMEMIVPNVLTRVILETASGRFLDWKMR